MNLTDYMKQKFLIIGSGLAGSLLCNELSKDHDVTLLDEGPENSIRQSRFFYVRKQTPGWCESLLLEWWRQTNLR